MPLPTLHDASLVSLALDWESGECRMQFIGGPGMPGSVSIQFSGVRSLNVPRECPWGSSVSVLKLSEIAEGSWHLEMQSGDTIFVAADLLDVEQQQ